MVIDYTAFFSTVHLSVDRIEIKINNVNIVEALIQTKTDFVGSNVYEADFHGIQYIWKKYKCNNKTIYLIHPKYSGTYYKPRLLLLQPDMHVQQEIVQLLVSHADLYFKVAQLEIAMDLVFKNNKLSEQVETLMTHIDNSTYVTWGRKSTSFNVKATKYRVNTNKKNIQVCTKPIRMYSKKVNNKEVLRFELMLNNASADVFLPFILTDSTIFKYIKFYKPVFNISQFNKLLQRMSKRGADINKVKRKTNHFLNRQTYTINERILKLKQLVKEHLPTYNCAKSIANCLTPDKELTDFIINNVHIKGGSLHGW